MLDAALKSQLKDYLTRLREPVELAASLDDGASSREMAALLDDIASLSDKVTVVRRFSPWNQRSRRSFISARTPSSAGSAPRSKNSSGSACRSNSIGRKPEPTCTYFQRSVRTIQA